jgi:hypothetical protein
MQNPPLTRASPAPAAEDWRLRLFDIQTAYQRELLVAVVSFATAAIRSLFLLNGGAVIAILAFYGDLLAGGGGAVVPRPAALVAALALFIAGLIAAFLCAAAAYLGQLVFVEAGRQRLARALRGFALLGAAASVTLFGLGAFRALGLLGFG